MHYREARVQPPLDAFVECVWFLTAAAPPANGVPPDTQRILPDGCIELVLHVADPFLAVSHLGSASPQPRAFVVGLQTRPFVVQAGGASDTIGVRFRPGGACAFFPCPLAALTDRAVSLDDLWGASAHQLWERVAAARSDTARLAIVEPALLARLAAADHDRVTASAVGDFVRSAGRARVSFVAARAGVTTRHLQRRFAERVGVGPKALARILRFQNTLRLRAVCDGRRTDWVRIAAECGYADQSHLIHDYAAFAGDTPASLIAAEGELSSYFTAPQRLAALFDGRRYG